MKKIACLNKISKVGTALFTADYEVAGEDVTGATGVLVRSAAMHEMELDDSVLCVARAGAGVNNIPLDKYAAKGVVVFNTPGANANAVKELVIAGMLISSRDLIGGNEWVKANAADANIAKAAEKAKAAYGGTEILGKTIAVVGLGAIGVLVANVCVNLGMNVIGYDPYLSPANAAKLDASIKVVSLEDAVKDADFITIHVPAMDATKGMINEALINSMKNGAIILNFSRDTLVVETALKAALEAGKIRKYVTDFANPLSVTMPNTIVLPHLGASTEEAEDNCAAMAVKQSMNFIENGNIVNSVNYPAIDAGVAADHRVVVLYNATADANAIAAAVKGATATVSKVKGAYGAMIVDAKDAIDVNAVAAVAGVIKARIVK